MGAAAATAGPPAQAPGGDDPGSTAQQRPMGKQYRALLSGLLDPDEVRVCPWLCCRSNVTATAAESAVPPVDVHRSDTQRVVYMFATSMHQTPPREIAVLLD
jgi:hypothetical protein